MNKGSGGYRRMIVFVGCGVTIAALVCFYYMAGKSVRIAGDGSSMAHMASNWVAARYDRLENSKVNVLKSKKTKNTKMTASSGGNTRATSSQIFLATSSPLVVSTGAAQFSVVASSSPLVVVSAAPATTATQFPVSLDYSLGLSVGNTFPYLSDAKLNAYMDDIASLGVGWLRMDFSWNDVQYTDDSHYDWAPIDRVVAAANARQIKILPILLATPQWSRDPSCRNAEQCAPRDPALFARFAEEAAKRYAPLGVHHWEIWNEPNMGDNWGAEGNVAGYVKLLKLTSVAIRRQDPGAVVITGGVGPAVTDGENVSSIDFITGLYAHGAKDYFDAIGVHPYTYPQPVSIQEDWNAWLEMAASKTNIRSVMTLHGDATKKIWATEYGAPTGGPGALATIDNYLNNPRHDHVADNLQALILSEAIAAHASQSWAGPLFWYSYIDLGTSSRTNENFFGLVRVDGSKKPAYGVLKNMAAGRGL